MKAALLALALAACAGQGPYAIREPPRFPTPLAEPLRPEPGNLWSVR